MTRLARSSLVLLAFLSGSAFAASPDAEKAQRLTVPLTDPGRPVTLSASLFSGGMVLEGYDGNQIVIEVQRGQEQPSPERSGGMRVIPNRSLGLTVEEENNEVSISSDFTSKIDQILVKVPRKTSVAASTVQGGDLVIRGVEGEMELSNTNGSITAIDIGGSVVAQSTNGDIKVTFTSIPSGKSMSFITFNGDVDVTFPGDLKADLRLSAGQGEIYTDFDFDLIPTEGEMKTEKSGKKYRVQLDQDVRARIRGGGPEMHFKTWNGDIFIRKHAAR